MIIFENGEVKFRDCDTCIYSEELITECEACQKCEEENQYIPRSSKEFENE